MVFCHFDQQESDGALDRTRVLQIHVSYGIFNSKKSNQLLPTDHFFGTQFL